MAVAVLTALVACGKPHARHPSDDAPLSRIAIDYAPGVAHDVWRALFAVLPASVDVEVDVATGPDFAGFMAELRDGDVPNRSRFHPAVGAAPKHRAVRDDAVSLDDRTMLVGDVRAGVALLGTTQLSLDDIAVQAARFDRAAARFAAKGLRVVRVPALVREGGGAVVTYTNALFDRELDGTRVVYLPTYSLPALDAAATKLYESEGFVVHPIDVTAIYARSGSLGGLVHVLARG